jgi:hypothetical protein
MKNKFDQKGSTLLYVMLVISGLLATALSVSNFVLSGTRQTGYFVNAEQSFYASESALEKKLYEIRKLDDVSDLSCTYSDVKCGVLIKSEGVKELRFTLLKDKSIEIDLSDQGGVEALSVSWSNPSAWIEYSAISWMDDYLWEDNNVIKKLGTGGSLSVVELEAGNKYKIRIKALSENVNDLVVKIYADDSMLSTTELAFPNYLSLTALGETSASTATIRVDMLRRPPVSGLFDYVLFSEDIIKK